MLLYREAPLRPKAGALRNRLNCLRAEAAKGKIRRIKHPYLVLIFSYVAITTKEVAMKKHFYLILAVVLFVGVSQADEYLGNYSANPYDPNSTSNPYGAGNPYNPNSINNPYGTYGNPYSPNSATNPYSTDAPKLYDSEGNYRGRLSNNPYDPDSVSNPYGTYGNPYSPDSINNPYGAGNPYSPDSPTNPYGQGLEIYGE